jgi:SAM-dependent methyltransferase
VSQFVADFSKIQKPDPEGKLDAPPFHRNHEPIWAAIGPWLAAQAGDALEIGSGTGQHIVAFARKTPGLVWWPADIVDAHLRSIAAWSAEARLANLRAPQLLDLTDAAWKAQGAPDKLTAIVCINVLHIAPWAVSQHLFEGAGRYLRRGGRLFIYGPFTRDGAHTAPSNAAFDRSLRAEDPAWGVRDVTALSLLAQQNGLTPIEAIPMPRHNFVLATTRR